MLQSDEGGEEGDKIDDTDEVENDKIKNFVDKVNLKNAIEKVKIIASQVPRPEGTADSKLQFALGRSAIEELAEAARKSGDKNYDTYRSAAYYVQHYTEETLDISVFAAKILGGEAEKVVSKAFEKAKRKPKVNKFNGRFNGGYGNGDRGFVRRGQSMGRGPRPDDRCMKCGKLGHWVRHCRAAPSGSAPAQNNG